MTDNNNKIDHYRNQEHSWFMSENEFCFYKGGLSNGFDCHIKKKYCCTPLTAGKNHKIKFI